MPDTVVLIPVLGRPHRVRPLLDSLEPFDVRVCFIPDPDDEPEKAAIREHGGEILLESHGGWAEKLNAGIRATDEPLIFLGADDLDFHEGWLESAKARLLPGVGVVGTNDLCNGRTMTGEHATHMLVTRAYAELPTIDGKRGPLCELYPHEYVDDEFVATAKHRGAWAHATDSVVEHLHVLNGKAPMDDLYAAMRPRMRQGRRIFNRRRHLWT